MESRKNKYPMKIMKPFGPSVVKLKIPDETITKMNDYVDKIINDKKKLEKLDHGSKLAGNVNQEFLLEPEFMKSIKWPEFLASACGEWVLYEQKKKMKSFQIIKSWIVRQFKYEYNPVHWHSGHVSGVGYLKVPENLGGTYQQNKKNNNGKLILLHGSRNLFSHSNLIIKPEVGDFYMFPSYLMHAVYPFYDTDDERRSVSFNAQLDENSGNF